MNSPATHPEDEAGRLFQPAGTGEQSPQGALGWPLRTLGAAETVIYEYSTQYPMHFCMVAGLVGCEADLSVAAVAEALTALGRRHPLLASRIGKFEVRESAADASGWQPRFEFIASARAASVVLSDRRWQDVVADELTLPLDMAKGPALRAVLVRAEGADQDAPAQRERGVNLVLSLAHEVCDGEGARRVLLDLVDALGGIELGVGTVPPSQEQVYGAITAFNDAVAREKVAAGLAVAGAPAVASVVPFDGPLVRVAAVTATDQQVERWRGSARDHGVHLQALVSAALSRAVASTTRPAGPSDGEPAGAVSTVHPIDLRRVLHSDDSSAVRLFAARSTTEPGQHLWEAAAAVQQELPGHRVRQARWNF